MVTSTGSLLGIADTAAGHWSSPQAVYSYLSPETTVSGWVASEQLRVGKVDFLAAQDGYNVDGIHISRMYWTGSNFKLRVPSMVSVDNVGSRVRNLRLALRNFEPDRKPIEFIVEVPIALRVKLTVYDVMGRKVTTLLEKAVLPGQTVIRWNGTSIRGTRVGSGMYFALLTFNGGTRTLSFPMLK